MTENTTIETLQAENQRLRQRIDDLERSSRQAEETNSLFRHLFEQSGEAAFLIEDGRFTMCNQASLDLFGCSDMQQLLNHHPAELSPEYQPDGRNSYEKANEIISIVQQQGRLRFEWYHRTVTGEVFAAEIFLATVHLDNRTIIYGNWKNISDRKQAEQELQESEARYRVLIENMQDGVFVVQGGKIVFANDTFSRMLGYTRRALWQKNITELIAPEDAALVLDRYARRQAGEEVPDQYEFHMLHRDGKTRILVHMTVATIYFQGAVASMSTVRDITEHNQVQEALLRSETMVAAMCTSMPIVLFMLDQNGIFTISEGRGLAALGLQPGQVVGMSAFDVYRDTPEICTHLRQSLAGEIVNYLTNLGDLVFETWSVPMYDAQGKVDGVFGFALDVTEQQYMQNALHQNQMLIQSIIDNYPAIVYTKDSQDRYTLANDQAMQFIGRSRNEILGKTSADLFPPELATQFSERDFYVFQTGITTEHEYTIPIDDGPHTYLLTTFPLRGSSEEIYGVCGISLDITERKQAEEERAALHEQVIDAQRAALRELSTPLIPVSDEVLIVPLIGAIDSGRAQQVLETLLEGVAQHRARLAIVDITGVSVVDTPVAQALVQAAQAVRLLGAQVMLTGIQPQIAQTLVNLGVDLSGIITRSSLQSGIIYALNHSSDRTWYAAGNRKR